MAPKSLKSNSQPSHKASSSSQQRSSLKLKTVRLDSPVARTSDGSRKSRPFTSVRPLALIYIVVSHRCCVSCSPFVTLLIYYWSQLSKPPVFDICSSQRNTIVTTTKDAKGKRKADPLPVTQDEDQKPRGTRSHHLFFPYIVAYLRDSDI